ncbi:Protein-tyrosine-phosphatase [Pollutimonas bauzanensis]|uniref:Protein-tyrosine-phosphatase n=1 Tax=Pollutimonas bauzanensis TaxID=658167 RepID=A0A1M5YJK8_9BURK|nr:Protein-tyrosine-phosphatase [Pollutimonas bauzanensis]
MADKTYNVLFICTHNSARSILAEGLMNELSKGRFKAFSAGSDPAGQVSPFAFETLKSLGIPTTGFRSKGWEEFAKPDALRMDFILTVCDKAAGEVCPVWPGQPSTAHWGVADPAAFEGADDARLQQFRAVAITLTRRIELLLSLPLHRLDALAIKHEITDIGKK